MNCPICQLEFANKTNCNAHLKKHHGLSSSQLKNSEFVALSEDGLNGITILENGKAICTVCSVAQSNKGNGKAHFIKKHVNYEYQQEVDNNNNETIESQLETMFKEEEDEA